MTSLWDTTKLNKYWIDPEKLRECKACHIWKKIAHLHYYDSDPPICYTCFNNEFIKCETWDCTRNVKRLESFKCRVCVARICITCLGVTDICIDHCASCRINLCSHMAQLSKSCSSCPRIICDHCSRFHCNFCVTYFICKRVDAAFPRDVIKIIQKYLG